MSITSNPLRSSAQDPANGESTSGAPGSGIAPVLVNDPLTAAEQQLAKMREDLLRVEAEVEEKRHVAELALLAKLDELPGQFGQPDRVSFLNLLHNHWGIAGPAKMRRKFNGRAKLTPEKRRQWDRELRNLGRTHKTVRQVSKEFGVSRALSYDYMKRQGIPRPADVVLHRHAA